MADDTRMILSEFTAIKRELQELKNRLSTLDEFVKEQFTILGPILRKIEAKIDALDKKCSP
jgi:hypothetical protein